MSIKKGTSLSIPSNRKDANKNTHLVLLAAYKVFAKKGYEATIEEIAAEAGVGVGTVHRRFSNKTILAVAVVSDVFSKMKEDQLEILKTNMPVDHKIRRLFDIFAAAHLQHGKIYSLGLHLATIAEIEDVMKNSLLSCLEGCLQTVIEEGQKEGIFRAGDPKLLELMIINMINPALIVQLNEHMPADQIAKYISDMILSGLVQR
jgi:AcrR family transcriptional regulator